MDVDAVQKRARADLLIPTTHGDPDPFLWEHSLRVASNCIRIASFDDLAARNPDSMALMSAGLYLSAAWAKRCRAGEIQHLEVLIGPPQDGDAEVAAEWMRQSLEPLLSSQTLDCAAAAILSRNDRALATLEGQILSDAGNLEEFGIVSLWTMVRRSAVEGKGIGKAIEVWRRKKQYQFWTARLADSFRFESVRELARQRLRNFERVMEELAVEALVDESLPFTESPQSSAKR